MQKLIALLFVSSVALAAPLTLNEAIEFALNHSPDLSIQQQQQNIAALQLDNTKANLLPSLDVGATHGILKTSPQNPTDPWQSAMGATLNENIYDNGVTLTQIQINKINKDIATLNVLFTREQLILDVATEFYNYSLAQQIAELKGQQLQMLDVQFRTVEGQYKDGIRTRQDFLRFKTQTQRADIDHRNALNDKERSRVRLLQLLGVALPDQSGVSFEAVNPSLPLENEKVGTPPDVDKTYQVKIAKATASLAPLNVTLAEKQYWPQFTLTGNMNYSNNGYIGSGQPFESTMTGTAQIFLNITYNIWDWGIRRRNVEVQHSNEQIQNHTLRKAKLDTNQQIKGLMIDISQAQDNYRLSKELVSLEQESSDLLQQRYREGKVTYLDVITAMNDLLDSKTRFYTSYFLLAENIAKYRFYEGALYESIQQKRL